MNKQTIITKRSQEKFKAAGYIFTRVRVPAHDRDWIHEQARKRCEKFEESKR